MRAVTLFALLAFLFSPVFPAANAETVSDMLRQVRELLAKGEDRPAIELCNRILAEDPNNIEAIARRAIAYDNIDDYAKAKEGFGKAIQAEPRRVEWYFYRSQMYAHLEQWWDALADAETMLRIDPSDTNAYLVRSTARRETGDLDGALEDIRRHQGDWPQDTDSSIAFGHVYRFMGRHREAAESYAKAFSDPANRASVHTWQGICLAWLGQFQEAEKNAAALETVLGSPANATFLRVYIHALARGTPLFDPDKSLESGRRATSKRTDDRSWTALGVALTASEAYWELVSTFEPRIQGVGFETLVYLANAHFEVGNQLKATQYLERAFELNPYASWLVQRFPRLEEHWKNRQELASQRGASGSKLELGREEETHLLTVSQIEGFYNRMKYAKAREEYSRYLGSLKSPLRQEELERRLRQTAALEKLHGKLITAIRSKRLQPQVHVAGVKLTIVDVDGDRYSFTFPKGSGKSGWIAIDPPELLTLFRHLKLDAEDLYALGVLATERGMGGDGIRAFGEATRAKPELKRSVDEFIAARRGIHVPEGGFVLYRGRFVTHEEKENLTKGLVRFGQEWVTAADKKMLEKGLIKIAGKWLPKDEAELVARGYRKWQGKWVSQKEYLELRSKWDNAIEQETAHYSIKTNVSEEVAKELGSVLEVAYEELKKFYGAEPDLPKGQKMTLYAFKSFEDYRKYCVENKAEDHLNAAGFARSDSNVVVGYDKMQNTQMLLRTMVHEAAHLYYFRVRPWGRAPSWYAEGMATYFEGFAWKENRWQFDFRNNTRTHFVKKAQREGKLLPWEQFFEGEALNLINEDSEKSLTFYAQSWAMLYYLKNTSNKAYQDRFAEYCQYIDKGQPKSFQEILGPLYEKFRQDWEAFVQSL